MPDLSAVTITAVELIDAGSGDDRIIASATNDVLRGGAGDDTFVFRPGFGHDVILDFEAGSLRDPLQDRIDVRALGYANLAALLADAEQSGHDTLITIDAATSLTIANMALHHLRADDFRFA